MQWVKVQTWFLMHRVELKEVCKSCPNSSIHCEVPNAPCGVESPFHPQGVGEGGQSVPNAPCGVESLLDFSGNFI